MKRATLFTITVLALAFIGLEPRPAYAILEKISINNTTNDAYVDAVYHFRGEEKRISCIAPRKSFSGAILSAPIYIELFVFKRAGCVDQVHKKKFLYMTAPHTTYDVTGSLEGSINFNEHH